MCSLAFPRQYKEESNKYQTKISSFFFGCVFVCFIHINWKLEKYERTYMALFSWQFRGFTFNFVVEYCTFTITSVFPQICTLLLNLVFLQILSWSYFVLICWFTSKRRGPLFGKSLGVRKLLSKLNICEMLSGMLKTFIAIKLCYALGSTQKEGLCKYTE